MPARNGGTTPGFLRAMASETDQDPAEWPYNTKSAMARWRASLGDIHTMIVTMDLSPPNCAMLSWTQASASSWSRRPRLLFGAEISGAVGKPKTFVR